MAELIEYLKRARQRTLDRTPLTSDWVNIYYSGTCYALWRAAEPLTLEHARGLVLDAGSGRGGWRDVIARAGGRRESLDVSVRHGEALTWEADLMDMPQVPTGRYDCVVCHQVLEHLPRPWAALAEIHRVLKPGGTLVISVPHLSRLHELPHDYLRYTPNGLASLLRDSGFEIMTLKPYGGVFAFLHHQFAALILGLAAVFRPVYLLCVTINAPVSMIAVAIDRLIGRTGLLPNGVIAVARRPLQSVDDQR